MERRAAIAVGLGVVFAVAAQAWLWDWVVEDAAISFAFSRNLADGYGLVPYPGRERVEAFSNPSWTLLLAAFEALGAGSFTTSKVLGVVMGAAVVPVVAAMGRRVGSLEVAAVTCGASATLAVWCASGLENPLMLLLLAAGCLCWAVEVERRGAPWSALFFAGAALTRPEGLVYGLAAGALGAALALREGGDRRAVATWWAGWWLVLGLPVSGYEAFRLWYFAFPLPSTYYAKLGTLPVHPTTWEGKGWHYVRGWFWDSGAWALLPVALVGMTGARGRRAWVAAAGAVALAAVTLVPGPAALEGIGPWPLPEPPGWPVIRVAVFAVASAAAGLAALGRSQAPLLMLCWGHAIFAAAFAMRAQGDWMNGYRFMAPMAVYAPVLLAAGFGQVLELGAQSRARWARGAAVAVVAGGCLGWGVRNGVWLEGLDLSVTPWYVQRRVAHYEKLWGRLLLDRPYLALDHDMGAQVWWHEPSVGRAIDSRGLVDLPFALHGNAKPFVQDYVGKQHRLDFAHAHGSTLPVMQRLADWQRDWIEGPPYGNHDGNFLRRSLVLPTTWSGPRLEASFEGPEQVELVGARLLASEISTKGGLPVEVAVRALDRFRLVAFLANAQGEVVASWDLPPAYDWVQPSQWRRKEIFVGRFALRPPKDLPTGEHELGFAVLGGDGAVRAAAEPSPTPRFAAGELRLAELVQVLPHEEVTDHADAAFEGAVASAAGGTCEEAEESWDALHWSVLRDRAWLTAHRPLFAGAVAACWAGRASGLGVVEAAALLGRARAWDVTSAEVDRVAGEVAAEAWPKAERARREEDHERAFLLFDAIVKADPSQAWARRYAEEARVHRLGLMKGAWVRAEPEAGPD